MPARSGTKQISLAISGLPDAGLVRVIHGTVIAIELSLTDYRLHQQADHGPQVVEELVDLFRFCTKLGRLHAEVKKRKLDLSAVMGIKNVCGCSKR